MNNLTLDNFLNLLFEPNEQTCFSHDLKGYKVTSYPALKDVYFCINALHPTEDRRPEQAWHRSNLPRRADHNVISFRNFLIEIDSMPLEQQIAYVTSKVPVSAITYSGGKSYHFILSLTTPATPEKYREIALRLHSLLPASDSSTKNASRFSRIPTAVRPDTGKCQTLVELHNRISLQTLEPMLPLVKMQNVNPIKKEKSIISADAQEVVNRPDVVMQRLNFGRNALFHYLGQRLKELELDEEIKQELVDRAYANLSDATSFSLNEAYNAARIKG